VVLPNLLKYFDSRIANGEEAKLIQLLSEYLMEHKSLVSVETNGELKEFTMGDSSSADESGFLDFTVNARNLSHFVRCLEAKKNDGISLLFICALFVLFGAVVNVFFSDRIRKVYCHEK